MESLSTSEAAKRKDVSRQTVLGAIKRGQIRAYKNDSGSMSVIVNEKFEKWRPMRVRQDAAKARWAKQSK